MSANLTPIQAIFGPLFMSISDILLLYYLCGGTLDYIRKQKTWIPWFIFISAILIGSQLIFNGATNAQANFFLFYAVHIIVLFIFTRHCTDLHYSAGIYLVVLSVLADDICLVFYIAVTRQFFGVDLIDTGTFGDSGGFLLCSAAHQNRTYHLYQTSDPKANLGCGKHLQGCDYHPAGAAVFPSAQLCILLQYESVRSAADHPLCRYLMRDRGTDQHGHQ